MWELDDLEEDATEQAERAAAMDKAAAQVAATPNAPVAPQAVPQVGDVGRAYQTLTEAQRRLEKAGLYQALVNQAVFGQNSARPEIINEVTQDLKSFALDRLEVMLGMRSAAPAVVPQDPTVSLTPEEVQAVRELLRSAYNGSILILSSEESTAIRLLISKITGKPPTLPTRLVPAIQQVAVASAPTAFLNPSPPPAAAPLVVDPPPRKKYAATRAPKRVPMPSQDMINAKITQDAANIEGTSAGNVESKFLSLAIQTALKS